VNIADIYPGYTEGHLDMYNFICGNAQYKTLGTGISTYPNVKDENHVKLHQYCIDLEKYGFIKRHFEDEISITWVKNEQRFY